MLERAIKRLLVLSQGGADSDILIDLCEKAEPHFVQYVFFDTGIEYQATKEHLGFLEQKYGIEIIRQRAKIPVPLGNKRYGMPFLNKRVSDMISRLQKHKFKWEDESFDDLYAKYPNCKAALKWWTNGWGEGSACNIAQNSWLKEYIMKNPPEFPISNKCCDGAKKNTSDTFIKANNIDLSIIGVRRAERGARAMSCSQQLYYNKTHHVTTFYPILYMSNADRAEYEREFGITHSNCYSEYGLERTGCCGCPYNRSYNAELEILQKYEPKLYNAINNIWHEVYEYTYEYHKFQKLMNLKYKKKKKCGCGCVEFTGDDVAMNLKYFGRNTTKLLCRECFQAMMNMNDKQWSETIEGFKAQGCTLF